MALEGKAPADFSKCSSIRRKLRVLYVVGSYHPAFMYGGPIYSVHRLGKELAATGDVSVDVLTTDINGRGRLPVETGVRINVDGVWVTYCRTTIGNRVIFSIDHLARMYREIRSYDIVHLQSVFSLTTLYGSGFSRLRRIPYIISPLGSLVSGLIARRGRWRKKAWVKAFDRRNLELAAAVKVTTETEANEIRNLRIKPRRLAVIPNGVDEDIFFHVPTADVEAFLQKFGISLGENIILFLGRINWEKGFDLLIPACGILARNGVPFRLVLAGFDSDGYRADVERMVAAEGLTSYVTFTGFLAGEEKKACIASSRVVVLPSVSENFGIAAAEGMAAGKPVIVTEGVGISTDVRECAGGFVVPSAVRRLADALGTLLCEPALAREMGARAAVFARERYSWTSIASETLRLYREVLEEERSTR